MTKEHGIWPKFSLFYILHKNVDDQRIRKNIALGCLKSELVQYDKFVRLAFSQFRLNFSQLLCDQGM